MFGIGPAEIIIIIGLLFVFLLLVGGVIYLIVTLLRPKRSNSFSNQSERLKELQKMKNEGLINEDEFNKKRNEIINEL